MAHLFISLCGLNLEVDGSPVLEEVAAGYLNLGVAIFDVDGGLILAFNFSSLAYAVLILKLTAHLCWRRLLRTIPQSWGCHLRCCWWAHSHLKPVGPSESMMLL